MGHKDKVSRMFLVSIKKYNTETPEEFLRWRMILNEQMENHGYIGNYEMVMNSAQTMLMLE
jgi:hypothetical protein